MPIAALLKLFVNKLIFRIGDPSLNFNDIILEWKKTPFIYMIELDNNILMEFPFERSSL